MRRRGEQGFTLIELVLALTIVALMVTILFAGLRVGLHAWQRGEERAANLQHGRSLTQLLEESLGGAYPFTGQLDQDSASPVLLFKGEADRVAFVTVSPPMPLSGAIPFVAVTLSIDSGTSAGLAIREKALPNFDPFEMVAPSVVDPAISGIHFRYLRDGGGWEDSWDAASEAAMPRAIEVTLTATVNGQLQQSPPLVVSIQVNAP